VKMKRHYCTYFDANYLTRGLALYDSLTRHARDFTLHALALDETVLEALTAMRLPGMRVIPLEGLEAGDAALAAAKANRSFYEYYFTCTPSFPLFVMRGAPEAEMVTYLDADLFLFSSPDPIFSELGRDSVLMVAHRFAESRRQSEEHGIYNVGWLTFRNDAIGHACLKWWRERCLEWCYDRVEPGRYGDQKYLDDCPARFPGVAILRHKGGGLAPWNVSNYGLTLGKHGVEVDAEPLIFYHFSGCQWRRSWAFDPCLDLHGARADKVIKRGVYARYIEALRQAELRLRSVGIAPPGRVRTNSPRGAQAASWRADSDGGFLRTTYDAVDAHRDLFRRIRKGKCWVVVGGRVL
jgi:hypothetical protein